MLTFKLDGNAQIIGAGNGDPMYLGEDHPKNLNCKEFSIPAFNGLAQILIQSSDAASTVTLQCISKGLKNSSITILTSKNPPSQIR